MIVSAQVDWMSHVGNAPHIKLVLAEKPYGSLADLRFEARESEDGTFYLAKKGEFAKFFFASKRDQSGYGGSIFEITLLDETKKTLIGPWSSNTASINYLYGTQYCESVYKYPEGLGLWYPCAVDIHAVLPYLEEGITFEKDQHSYIPRIGKLNWRESKILMRTESSVQGKQSKKVTR